MNFNNLRTVSTRDTPLQEGSVAFHNIVITTEETTVLHTDPVFAESKKTRFMLRTNSNSQILLVDRPINGDGLLPPSGPHYDNGSVVRYNAARCVCENAVRAILDAIVA